MPSINKRIAEMKEWVNAEGSKVSTPRTMAMPSRARKPVAAAPGDFKHHPWQFRLEQIVYCRATGNTPLSVTGGFFDGRLNFPHYRLRDLEGTEMSAPQVALSARPFDTDR